MNLIVKSEMNIISICTVEYTHEIEIQEAIRALDICSKYHKRNGRFPCTRFLLYFTYSASLPGGGGSSETVLI